MKKASFICRCDELPSSQAYRRLFNDMSFLNTTPTAAFTKTIKSFCSIRLESQHGYKTMVQFEAHKDSSVNLQSAILPIADWKVNNHQIQHGTLDKKL